MKPFMQVSIHKKNIWVWISTQRPPTIFLSNKKTLLEPDCPFTLTQTHKGNPSKAANIIHNNPGKLT